MAVSRRDFLKGGAAVTAGVALGMTAAVPKPEAVPEPAEQVATRQVKGEIALGTESGRLVGRQEILLEESTGGGYTRLKPVSEPVVFEKASEDWGTITHVVLFGRAYPLHMGMERPRYVRRNDTARVSGIWARTFEEK